jgi:hypothetical protein
MTEQRPLVPEDLDARETERRCAKEREMRQANQVESHNEGWDSWNAWADGRIAAALERHDKIFTEAVGEALGETREDLREEFRKELEAATGKLGVELRELITGLRTEFARLETELAQRLTRLEIETAGLRLRGAYRWDQDYDRLDVVTLDGSSYIARQHSPGPCPGEGWRILASAGATGPQGTPDSEQFRPSLRTCRRVDGRLMVRRTDYEGGSPRVRHSTARIPFARRRSGGRMATHGARAAAGDAGDRIP